MMLEQFREISPKDLMENPQSLVFNPFEKIGKEWYLITGGSPEHYNTMTASWGTMGVFWSKPVVNSFIRPQRYTYEFVEQNDLFTLSFFSGEAYRKALNFCGSHSGRDVDKAKECGLTPIAACGSTAFAEADLILVCKKLYWYDLTPDQMIDKSIDEFYLKKDYHRCYFGEIVACYSK